MAEPRDEDARAWRGEPDRERRRALRRRIKETEEERAERHAASAEARRARRARRRPFLLGARALFSRLPMPAACLLGEAVGRLVYLLSPGARARVLRHLELGLGAETTPRERRRIALRNFGRMGRGLFAWLVLHRLGPERALRRIAVEGEAEIVEQSREGGGVVLVTFHFGLFELLGVWCAHRLGARAVGREADTGGATEMLIGMRRDMGVETIERGEPREILRTLRERRPIAFLADQDVDEVRGAFVPFLGRPSWTPLGPAALAVRTGRPIVLGFVRWDGLSRHVAWTHPPLHARKDLDPDAAALELTARFTALGEREVRRRPEHWLWLHERWATRPGDRPDAPVAEAPA